MLWFILFYYNAELSPTLKHRWLTPSFITLLENPNLLLCWRIPCLITLLSILKFKALLICNQFLHIYEVHSVLSHSWTVPFLITTLRYILFYYNLELFPTLEHCWRKRYLITLPDKPKYIAGINLAFFHCWVFWILGRFWAVPNSNTVMYILSRYIAVVYFLFYLAGQPQF